MVLSVCIITRDEEANIVRTLESVKGIADEIIVVDSGSTDNTVALAESCGAKVFVEEWKGFAAQKNSALAKAAAEGIWSLDADEEVGPELAASIKKLLKAPQPAAAFYGYIVPRRHIDRNSSIRPSGSYPARKLQLAKRERAPFGDRAVQ